MGSSTLWACLGTRKGKVSLVLIAVLSILLFTPAFNPTSISSHFRGDSLPFPAASQPEYSDGYQALPSHLEKIFPPPDAGRRKYQEWNMRTLAELHSCMALERCGRNQKKVALLASHWFEEAIVRGWRGGEGVWGLSMYKHLRALGYTTLFANSFEEALEQYRMFPELVKIVVRQWAGDCHADPQCVKGPDNPSGIPAWKIFDFEYFTSPHGSHARASLLKGKWILSANPDHELDPSPIQYIGYSIEDECRAIPPAPLSQRPNRVWMLMKQLTYVYDHVFAWDRTWFTQTATALNLTFTGAWQIDQHYQWDPVEQGEMSDIVDPEHGLVNIGKVGPEEFAEFVRMSKVMVGMGNPWWSPSPYHALCKGVPFVNPVLQWDTNDPWNKARWNSQHPSLQQFDSPYVYHVHAHNYTGFVHAIREASQTEIPSFIPDHMTEMAVRNRCQQLMETDWRTEAEVLLQERLQELEDGGSPYLFEL